MLRPLARFVGGVVEGLFGRAERPVRARAQPRRRWLLEALEDRLAPANFTVNDDRSGSFGAGNAGTLRYCIEQANMVAGPHTVTIDTSVTQVTLTTALDSLQRDISIVGHGANAITVTRDPAATTKFRIFTIDADKTCSIEKLTISGGRTDSANGGGVYNAGTLTLKDLIIQGNYADGRGGGVYNDADATLTADFVDFVANEAVFRGGGLCNAGTATVRNNSSFLTNRAALGGGIYNEVGKTTTLTGNTLILYNYATQGGGGVDNRGVFHMTGGRIEHNEVGPMGVGGGISSGGNGMNTQATLTNVVITLNTGGSKGGGLYLYDGDVYLEDCTVTNNTATAGSAIWYKVGDSAYYTLGTCVISGTITAG